jgi:hypothetical protein
MNEMRKLMETVAPLFESDSQGVTLQDFFKKLESMGNTILDTNTSKSQQEPPGVAVRQQAQQLGPAFERMLDHFIRYQKAVAARTWQSKSPPKLSQYVMPLQDFYKKLQDVDFLHSMSDAPGADAAGRKQVAAFRDLANHLGPEFLRMFNDYSAWKSSWVTGEEVKKPELGDYTQ